MDSNIKKEERSEKEEKVGREKGGEAWGNICCQVPPPMQSGRVTKVALNDLSIAHFTK